MESGDQDTGGPIKGWFVVISNATPSESGRGRRIFVAQVDTDIGTINPTGIIPQGIGKGLINLSLIG